MGIGDLWIFVDRRHVMGIRGDESEIYAESDVKLENVLYVDSTFL